MNLFISYQYIYLIFFILLDIFRTTSSAALQHTDIFISLYNSTDKIAVLESRNFTSTVYRSNTAWVVEFYASWCGHCQTYANTYRQIGIDTWAWRSIVRIGAINCYGGDNTNICREHSIRGYPTILFIPPHANYEKKSNMTSITAMNANDVQKEIVKQLENLNRQNQSWPRFTPVNRLILEELYVKVPKSIKLIFVIVERRDDFTGRQVMLDFSDYRDQITIFRTTTDGKLWRKFHVNLTDIPALFLLHRNRTIERIDSRNHSVNMAYRTSFTNIIQSIIHEKNLIKTVTDTSIKDILDSKTVLEDAQLRLQLVTKNENVTDEIRDQNTVHKKVNMIDLELALSYMFRQEIPQLEDIRGEAYDALVQWLTVLTKYFPGRQSVMKYLKYVSSKVHAHSKGLNGNEFREIIDKKTSNAFLPNITQSYQHCAGSSPQYRGYPCALWLLFHTLTVSQYKTAILDSEAVNVKEIPMAIQSYVKYFFACRQCSENFMKETSDINRLDLNNQYEAIFYLWKVHNHVNQRLRYDASEDPKHPKVQFPSQYLCSKCYSKKSNPIEYNEDETIDFLLEYYSKKNIDSSLLSTERKDSSDHLEPIISRIEYIDQPSFFSRYSVYISIVILIILILIRRRYCQVKRERYIL